MEWYRKVNPVKTTGAKGIKLVRFNEHNPILGELYKSTTVSLPKTQKSAS